MRTTPTFDNCEDKAIRKPFIEKPMRLGDSRVGYDLTRALSLAAAFEDEEVLRKIERDGLHPSGFCK